MEPLFRLPGGLRASSPAPISFHRFDSRSSAAIRSPLAWRFLASFFARRASPRPAWHGIYRRGCFRAETFYYFDLKICFIYYLRFSRRFLRSSARCRHAAFSASIAARLSFACHFFTLVRFWRLARGFRDGAAAFGENTAQLVRRADNARRPSDACDSFASILAIAARRLVYCATSYYRSSFEWRTRLLVGVAHFRAGRALAVGSRRVGRSIITATSRR